MFFGIMVIFVAKKKWELIINHKIMLRNFLFSALIACGAGIVSAQTPQDSIEIVNAKWTVTQLDNGAIAKSAKFNNLYESHQSVFVVEIDPNQYDLVVKTHDGRELTTDKAKSDKAVAAINGTYFGKNGRSVCYVARDGKVDDYTTSGITLLSDGAVVVEGNDKNQVEIMPWVVSTESEYDVAHKSVMVSGPLMVSQGKECDFTDCKVAHIPYRNPRSAVALMRDGKIVLVVVDGRRKDVSDGVTIPQFAHMMRILGAKDALNLDGGGSSVIWNEKKGIMNTPSDGHERTVSNSILVIKK